MPVEVTPTLVIGDAEFEERFVRASGPGGQNVNKVSTAVQLRFDVRRSRSLTEEVRERLRALAGSRMTDEGVLVIDARARLADLIRQALVRPKRRRKTRPGKAAKQRRLDTKKRRAETKAGRGRLRGHD